MKAYELMEIIYEAMKRLSKVDVKMKDYKYLALYMEFNELVAKGEKKDYIREEAYLIGYIMQRIVRNFKS